MVTYHGVTRHLRELLELNFDAAAGWRFRKAEEFPDDERNMRAADELEHLAKTVNQIPEKVMEDYAQLCARNPTEVVTVEQFLRKAIGFRESFSAAEAFVERVIDLQADPGRRT
jgi:hypothetical protein